jgi:hypothetical protein
MCFPAEFHNAIVDSTAAASSVQSACVPQSVTEESSGRLSFDLTPTPSVSRLARPLAFSASLCLALLTIFALLRPPPHSQMQPMLAACICQERATARSCRVKRFQPQLLPWHHASSSRFHLRTTVHGLFSPQRRTTPSVLLGVFCCPPEVRAAEQSQTATATAHWKRTPKRW